jgi:hypothetical protein
MAYYRIETLHNGQWTDDPSPSELCATYAAALQATQSSGHMAAIRAAVAMILPDEADLPVEASFLAAYRQSERRRICAKFLALVDALSAQQEQADG